MFFYILLDFTTSVLYNNINNIININKEYPMFDVNLLLEQAISETKNLSNGETFLVKDLFKGYEWNRIPRKTRLLLGTLFLNAVSNDNIQVATFEKTSSNQQKYKKQ